MASSITQAREGSLYLMLGGKPSVFEKAKPVLEKLAGSMRYVGGTAPEKLAGVTAAADVIVTVVTDDEAMDTIFVEQHDDPKQDGYGSGVETHSEALISAAAKRRLQSNQSASCRPLNVSSAMPDLSSWPSPSKTILSYCAFVASASGSSTPTSRARRTAMPLSFAAWAELK